MRPLVSAKPPPSLVLTRLSGWRCCATGPNSVISCSSIAAELAAADAGNIVRTACSKLLRRLRVGRLGRREPPATGVRVPSSTAVRNEAVLAEADGTCTLAEAMVSTDAVLAEASRAVWNDAVLAEGDGPCRWAGSIVSRLVVSAGSENAVWNDVVLSAAGKAG